MLIALDFAILPPPAVSKRAVELSASLPAGQSKGLILGGDRLPHITLTQQFVRAEDLDVALYRVAAALADQRVVRLRVTGAGRGNSSVWMAIERSAALVELHRRLMDTLSSFEQPDGSAAAFVDGVARRGDVAWVAGFRRTSSFDRFTPHITLGHATRLPHVEPVAFDAGTIAACQLGEFCTCRRVLRRWELQSGTDSEHVNQQQ
jgi:2'-5' RNA ligase